MTPLIWVVPILVKFPVAPILSVPPVATVAALMLPEESK